MFLAVESLSSSGMALAVVTAQQIMVRRAPAKKQNVQVEKTACSAVQTVVCSFHK